MKRPIIEIDEEKCNGCGQCVPDCAEGALAVIDGKARLISEVFCDGLGACLNCPQGALTLTTREAPDFDEAAALAAKAQRETPNSPDRPAPMTPPAGGCPGSAARVLVEERNAKNGLLCGRTESSIIVEFPGEDALIGTFQDVRVTEARNWILRGERIG